MTRRIPGIEDQATAPPAGAPAARLRLAVIGEGKAQTHPLRPGGRVVVGRSSKCDLRIDDPSVSREHLAIQVGAMLEVEDLGSSNGTRLRDLPLEPGERTTFVPGEVIEAGSFLLIVQAGGETLGGGARAEPDTAPDVPAGDLVVEGTLRDLLRLVERIAKSDISALLLGETGVGKEVIAERLHGLSGRRDGPFVRLNCAALTETLLESELFGHERGAFTGATRAKPGLLETADGGTVFLDEVGEMPAALQAKLLRVLEDRKVLRVGAVTPRAVDVRYVAATNRDLEAEVARGAFRADLFYRLSGVTLLVPPLRERREEIEPLARTFLAEASRRLARSEPTLGEEARQWLLRHAWPGNIRELKNVIERAALLCEGTRIELEHLPAAREPGARSPVAAAPAPAETALAAPPDLPHEIREIERKRILEALEACAGNQTRAAKRLGISRKTLLTRLDEYGIPRPRKPAPESGT